MTEATNEVNVSNVVTMSNGEKVDFGKNGTVISSYDVDAGTVTFKVATGEVLVHQAQDLEYLSIHQREVYLYGLREKVKTTLAPIKLVVSEAEAAIGKITKAAKIALELKAFSEGKFVTRSSDNGSVELSNFMKAFAYVCATGQVLPSNEALPTPALDQLLVVIGELKSHWVATSDMSVVVEITAYWNALDRKVKSSFRRNAFISTIEAYIEAGIVTL